MRERMSVPLRAHAALTPNLCIVKTNPQEERQRREFPGTPYLLLLLLTLAGITVG